MPARRYLCSFAVAYDFPHNEAFKTQKTIGNGKC